MQNMKDHLNNIDDEKIKRAFAIKSDYDNKKISLEEAQKLMQEKVKQLNPSEIAYMEQTLKEFDEDECQKESIQQMLEIFKFVMTKEELELDDEHPISCYKRENKELLNIMLEIEDLIQYPVIKNQWLDIYERLEQYKIHLSRKQNQLYSILETKGFDRPTTTMWTLDNYIRDEISQAYTYLKEDKEDEFITLQQTIINDVRDLVEKEETILYPTSLSLISEKEFEDMKSGDNEIGFAWIKVQEKNKDKKNKEDNVNSQFNNDLLSLLSKYNLVSSNNTEFDVSTGKLTLEQINLIFRHMPVDLSYVDENEIVKFYSDTTHRVFPRSKNVIGRNVKNCHPRSSVHIVEEIIEKFRSGEQDSAEFWINKPELFIYIYYVAVRDENGKFRGILEMMQDCTHIRKLTGSQTLLTWSNGKSQIIEDTNNKIDDTQEVLSNSSIDFDYTKINKETKLTDILNKFPQLKNDLPKINNKFKMLNSPLARIMLPKATIQLMSERTGMDSEDLIEKIKTHIKNNYLK